MTRGVKLFSNSFSSPKVGSHALETVYWYFAALERVAS